MENKRKLYNYLLEGAEMQSQSDAERETFDAFTRIAPFRVISGTIESRCPPEPDIVCEIEGLGLVGFELTELIDQQYRARVKAMFDTKEYLADFCEDQIESSQREILQKRFSDAHICITYEENSSYRRRKVATNSLIQTLLALPERFNGEVPLSDHPIDSVIRRVHIDRADIVGPCFDVDSYGRLGDPTYQAIAKKLAKSYTCDYPFHLLAHIDTNLLPSEEVWKQAANNAAELLERSQFKKIWVFDKKDETLKYEIQPA